MESITTKKSDGSKIDLGKINIHVSSERGLQITLQSNRNFRFLTDETDKTFKLGGVDCFVPRGGNGYQLPGVFGYFRTEKESFQAENYLNLSMLLAKDINKGVTFNFGIFPLSEDKVNELASNFKQQIKMLWATYMREINVSMTFTASIVETEEV